MAKRKGDLVTLQLRKAGVSDIEILALMNSQLIEDEGSQNPMSIQQLEVRMLNWLKEHWEIDLICESERVVGYALYQFRQNPYFQEQDEVYLRQYFISREHRGKGLGLEGIRVLKESRFNKASTIVIDVLESNSRGMNFWRKAGFLPYYVNMRLTKYPITLCSQPFRTEVEHDTRK